MSTIFQLNNKRLLVNVDHEGRISDLCWPNPAENNLTLRTYIENSYYLNNHKVQGNLIYEGQRNGEYYPSYSFTTLIQSKEVDIKTVFDLRSDDHLELVITIINPSQEEITVNHFNLNHIDFGANYNRDTAYFDPKTKGITHYENDIYLAVFASIPPKDFTCNSPDDNNGRGARPDKGLKLGKNPVTTGKAQSCLGYEITVPQYSSKTYNLNFVFANNLKSLHLKAFNMSPRVNPEIKTLTSRVNHSEIAYPKLKLEKDSLEKLHKMENISRYLVWNSFLECGGNFAAVDSSFYKTKEGVDDYSYFWPRDGVFALYSLLHDYKSNREQISTADKTKFLNLCIQFFDYADKCLVDGRYMFHRYRLNPKGTFGSSWYSYIDDSGSEILPLQLDQTALLLWIIAEFKSVFPKEVKYLGILDKLSSIGDFLLEMSNGEISHSNCYDLWENDYGAFASTTAATIAGLKALSNLSYEDSKTTTKRSSYEIAAKSLTYSLLEKFSDEDGLFFRGYVYKNGSYRKSTQKDASVHWLWKLGVLPPDQSKLEKTIAKYSEDLKTGDGLARISDDYYLQQEAGVSNPWFLSLIWFAQYYIARNDIESALPFFKSIINHADSTGLMAEMYHPITGYGLSVKPLIWNHAELLILLNYCKNI